MGLILVPLIVSWRLTFTVACPPSTCTASIVMPTCWDLIALNDSCRRFSSSGVRLGLTALKSAMSLPSIARP